MFSHFGYRLLKGTRSYHFKIRYDDRVQHVFGVTICPTDNIAVFDANFGGKTPDIQS